jgi:hypothetical protein
LPTPSDQAGGGALHFGVQFAEAVARSTAGFGGNEDQRRLVAALGQVPVDGVVAQVGGAADEPARERRLAGIAGSARGGPSRSASPARPRRPRARPRTAVELFIAAHRDLSPVLYVFRSGDIAKTEFIIMETDLAAS